ncbi:MAG: hypothetical protein H7235_06820 [Bdellovibrionaceae bacterium]|nr:hypothetical protein [Pseudobdellovibrionaceae bacterium]
MPEAQIIKSEKVKRSDKKGPERFGQYFKDIDPEKRPFSATINKPLNEVYALLSDTKNFPLFFENLEKIEEVKGEKSKWHFKNTFEQSTMAIAMKTALEKNGESIQWTSEDGAGIKYDIAAQLFPATGGRGTVVHMLVSYETKIGAVMGFFEKLFGVDADVLTKKNLQRFKAYCETGHVPTTEGQPSGRDEDQSETMKH